jgi:hypothetical protein
MVVTACVISVRLENVGLPCLLPVNSLNACGAYLRQVCKPCSAERLAASCGASKHRSIRVQARPSSWGMMVSPVHRQTQGTGSANPPGFARPWGTFGHWHEPPPPAVPATDTDRHRGKSPVAWILVRIFPAPLLLSAHIQQAGLLPARPYLGERWQIQGSSTRWPGSTSTASGNPGGSNAARITLRCGASGR